MEIADVDQDGELELRAKVDLAEMGHLPLIRVEQGGLPDVPLEVRIDGIGPQDKVNTRLAAGGVQGINFAPGDVEAVTVPFNLRAAFRPPRVTQIFPEEGSTLRPEFVSNALVIFSKPMFRDSLLTAGVIGVLRVEGSQETALKPGELVVGELYAGGPTRVEFRFDSTLAEGEYRVRVSQGALDTSGRALDQVPLQPGNQPFSSHFTITGPVAMAACSPHCEATWCGNGGAACPVGLSCDTASKSCLPPACPTACPTVMVCDPKLTACVDDCRVHGTYGGCPAGSDCSAATGLCAAP